MITDINIIAEKIDLPISEWPGKCYGIALACVEKGLVAGKVRYGHYLGYIAPESLFKKNRTIGFAQHGWVETSGGEIYDPTRWVFECEKPYVYVDSDDSDYDIGGSEWRNAMFGAPAMFESTSKRFTDLSNLSEGLRKIIKQILHDERTSDNYSLNQMFYLANRNPLEFNPFAKELYAYFEKTGDMGLVPIDYQNLVEDDTL
jgi:hypothetical protein